MADEKKSPFTRPQQPSPPMLGPDADKWIAEARGSSQSPAADQTPPEAKLKLTEDTGQAEAARQTKPERMKRLTIDIPASLHKRVKEQCATRETTIAEVVRKYLEKSFPGPERRKGE